MHIESENPAGQPLPSAASELGSAPNQPRPIADLIVDPDFPKSALGVWVDIGGYVGVVASVVSHSLKVKSTEGITKSFNAGGLRKLYGPRILPEPILPRVDPPKIESPVSKAPVAPPAPKREVIEQPDFSKPVRRISEFVDRPDYPKCAYGEHVEVGGYVGVVVEIVQRSLKVRSQAETTRSYNADVLRKLYGKEASPG